MVGARGRAARGADLLRARRRRTALKSGTLPSRRQYTRARVCRSPAGALRPRRARARSSRARSRSASRRTWLGARPWPRSRACWASRCCSARRSASGTSARPGSHLPPCSTPVVSWRSRRGAERARARRGSGGGGVALAFAVLLVPACARRIRRRGARAVEERSAARRERRPELARLIREAPEQVRQLMSDLLADYAASPGLGAAAAAHGDRPAGSRDSCPLTRVLTHPSSHCAELHQDARSQLRSASPRSPRSRPITTTRLDRVLQPVRAARPDGNPALAA
jgi:hypothetical protein